MNKDVFSFLEFNLLMLSYIFGESLSATECNIAKKKPEFNSCLAGEPVCPFYVVYMEEKCQ